MGKAANAIKAIKTKVLDATTKALQNASDDIMSTSRDAVRSWKNKPDFGDTLYVGLDVIEILIKPQGAKGKIKVFQYIDLGTKGPYLIPKFLVAGKFLRFRSGYSAMTAPIAQYNKGSGQSFGSWITKQQVVHPGIKARKFMETFMNEIIPALEVRVQTQITKVLV